MALGNLKKSRSISDRPAEAHGPVGATRVWQSKSLIFQGALYWPPNNQIQRTIAGDTFLTLTLARR